MYVGQSHDIERRLVAHNDGSTGFTTKAGGPWKLVYKEEYQTRSEAMIREKELKTGRGREFIKSKIIPG